MLCMTFFNGDNFFSSALNLMELLPPHLQDDKVAIATANPIVTGWMNPFKIK